MDNSEIMAEVTQRLEEAEKELGSATDPIKNKKNISAEETMDSVARMVALLEKDFYDCDTPERVKMLEQKAKAFNNVATPAINKVIDQHREEHYAEEYALKVKEQNTKCVQQLNETVKLIDEKPEAKNIILLGLSKLFGLTNEDIKMVESQTPKKQIAQKDVEIGVKSIED